jgi:putative membrane protein
MSNPDGSAAKATDYLANERTFLAWVRTSIAVMSLGFVVARFGIWLRELALSVNPAARIPTTGMSLPIGIAMLSLGSALALVAAWHYSATVRAIERGNVGASRRMVLIVAISVALLGATMIGYLLAALKRL